MKFAIALLPLFIGIYIYYSWIIYKENARQHIRDMNSKELMAYIANLLLTCVGIVMFCIGCYKSYVIPKQYEQEGHQIQGEIIHKKRIREPSGEHIYNYKISAIANDSEHQLYAQTLSEYEVGDIVNVYYLFTNIDNNENVLIIGADNRWGDYLISRATLILICSSFIWALRYQLFEI